MNINKSLDIVILAAGKGNRMKSVGLPKPLHTLNGIPIISYLLNHLPLSIFSNKFVVIPDNKSKIKETVSNFDSSFKYVFQSEPNGTGDALLQALYNLKSKNIIVMNSDNPLITEETMLKFVDSHINNQSNLSILVDKISDDIPGNYGLVKRSSEGSILEINENSRKLDCIDKEFNVGLYCFNLNWLKSAIHKIASQNQEMYITDLIKICVEDGHEINAVFPVTKSESLGINNKYELSVAEKIAQKRKNMDLMLNGVIITDPNTTFIDFDCEIEKGTHIMPGTIIKSNSKIKQNCLICPDAEITESCIANNTNIKKSVIQNSTIGANVNIGPFSHIRDKSDIQNNVYIGTNVEVKHSYINSGTKIGHFSYIGDSEIGENVNIGAGTVTCNFDGKSKQKTIIMNNVFIGSGTMIVAPIKIEENAKTGAGSIVTKNVSKNQLVFGNPATNKYVDWDL